VLTKRTSETRARFPSLTLYTAAFGTERFRTINIHVSARFSCPGQSDAAKRPLPKRVFLTRNARDRSDKRACIVIISAYLICPQWRAQGGLVISSLFFHIFLYQYYFFSNRRIKRHYSTDRTHNANAIVSRSK